MPLRESPDIFGAWPGIHRAPNCRNCAQLNDDSCTLACDGSLAPMWSRGPPSREIARVPGKGEPLSEKRRDAFCVDLAHAGSNHSVPCASELGRVLIKRLAD